MSQKRLLIFFGLVLMLVIGGLLILKPQSGLVGSDSMTQSVNSAPTLTPTPTPIPIDATTDLEEVVDGLDPEDFNGDFQKLD